MSLVNEIINSESRRKGGKTLRIGIAADHAGFALKEQFPTDRCVVDHEVRGYGAHALDPGGF